MRRRFVSTAPSMEVCACVCVSVAWNLIPALLTSWGWEDWVLREGCLPLASNTRATNHTSSTFVA